MTIENQIKLKSLAKLYHILLVSPKPYSSKAISIAIYTNNIQTNIKIIIFLKR